MTLPLPILDHVVVNARDRIDDAAATYARLGFALTPRGFHTLGSSNHLAVLGTDYLELLGVPKGSDARPELSAAPTGLNGIVFQTTDAAATSEALQAAGVGIGPARQFSRPVDIAGEARDAAFRTTALPADAVRAGRVYFCEHMTPELVWRDEWRRHPNGAVAIARAVIASDDPARLGRLFRAMFGKEAVRRTDDGFALVAGLARIEIVTPSALWESFGAAAPDSRGRAEYMAALTLRTTSLDMAEQALDAGGIRGVDRIGASVLVPAAEAFGVTIEFSV
jgi:hypothetical protein